MAGHQPSAEFRFYYFTDRYADTIHFYKNGLGLEVFRSWDRGEGDKGTIFHSPNGNGLIEIEEGTATPTIQAGLYIEVADVDNWHQVAIEHQLNIVQAPQDTSYGHRSVKLQDPNGLTIGLFSYIKRPV